MKTRLLIVMLLNTCLFGCSGGDSSNENTQTTQPSNDQVTGEDNNPGLGIQSAIIDSVDIMLNPSGVAPLTAELSMTTTQAVSLQYSVIGQHGGASTITQMIEEPAINFSVQVLGLYANYENSVTITLLAENGAELESHTISLQTQALPQDLPNIEIDVPSNALQPEFNFVNYFGFSLNFLPQTPFIFDQFGDIRWYLDFSDHVVFSDIFYDNGMSRLQNGNLVFGNISTGTLYEIDMLGQIIDSWGLQGNDFHHHVIEKPNGNLLATITDISKNTVEDVVVEIDRTTSEFVTVWDLNESLDNTRRAWPTNRANLNEDWFHGNGLEYSASDNGLIVSGRTQGIVKLNTDNQISYILAPHRQWNTLGNGTELSQFLLTPLDAGNNPITNPDVLSGVTNHADFEWAWYQHSPILLPSGNIMVFDNGPNRNYVGASAYSRAVEYEIDEQNRTIKQIWAYGKERGEETYSEIVSKVSFVPENNSILFTPGASVNNGTPTGKIIEIDYQTKEVIFEASMIPSNSVANISFHNVLRMSLYSKAQ